MNLKHGTAQAKQAIRQAIRQTLRATTPAERGAWSAATGNVLRAHAASWAREGGIVALFGGMATEPNLLPLLPWLLERGVRVALFAIEAESMVPFLVKDDRDILAGQLGVCEPVKAPSNRVDAAELSAVLLPGLAFSAQTGARLGRGKGFYDKALTAVAPECQLIGVCFQAQLWRALPCEAHDVAVQVVVTERGWFAVEPRAARKGRDSAA
ncbi:MAG: 5-formyltetrahydrofolate cyclo-ligase [Roseimicrobium sp.]